MLIVWSALIGAATAAFIAVVLHRIVAQKRAALDVLLEIRTDHDILLGREVLQQLYANNKFDRITNPSTDDDRQARKRVQNYLNALELVCVSIKRHVIDEKFARDLMGVTLVKTWERIRGFTEQIRETDQNRSIYNEIQDIAETWGDGRMWDNSPRIVKAMKEIFTE